MIMASRVASRFLRLFFSAENEISRGQNSDFPRRDGELVDSKQSWVVLVILFALANFLEVAVVAHFILFTPAFFATIGFSPAEITTWTGPTAAAGFILGIWFVPFWGVLADRYGRKPLILRSYFVEVAAMAIAAMSYNLWLYLFARALTGFALGNTGLMYAALTEIAPKNRVALAMGVVNGSGPLGAVVGGVAGGFVVAQYGVHPLFALDAAVAGLIVLLLFFFYQETFVPKPTPRIPIMLVEAIRAVVHSPVAATIFIVSFIANTAYFFSYSYFPVRIEEIVGAKQAPIAIGISQAASGVTTLTGSAIIGAFADRVGLRRSTAIVMLLATIIWLPIFLARGINEFTIGWAAMSLISPSIMSLLISIVSLNIPSEKRGAVLSMIYLPLNMAFIVGPFFAAFVATGLGVAYVFVASALLSLLALLVFVWRVNRTRISTV
jgi:MFS transporter, DHA1 family, multidrug resistance protein